MCKIYWARLEPWPVSIPALRGTMAPLGILEDGEGNVVGFALIETIGPDQVAVTCRKVWDAFSCTVYSEIGGIGESMKGAVELVFGLELDDGQCLEE